MDPNIQNTTPMQPQPITQAAPIQPAPPEKSSKMLFLILAVLTLSIVGISGIFFLANRQASIPEAKIAAPIVPQTSPSPITSPTIPVQATQTPEQALQDVTIVDPTTDMTDINADLNQL